MDENKNMTPEEELDLLLAKFLAEEDEPIPEETEAVAGQEEEPAIPDPDYEESVAEEAEQKRVPGSIADAAA